MRRNGTVPRGSLLLEVAMATGVLAVAIAISLQVIVALAHQRGSADRRQLAVLTAANTLELVAARSWNELAPGPIEGIDLDEATTQTLPGGRVEVFVEDGADGSNFAGMRSIIVTINWKASRERRDAPVRLKTWVSRAGRSRS